MKSENNGYDSIIQFIREIYGEGDIPLHRPVFRGNERQYLNDCIDSNYVSSVGNNVGEFEKIVASYTGVNYAIATVNGTAALHVALRLAGVDRDTEVLTQALTFIATCNAITYAGARPVFIDIDKDTLGMSPDSLRRFLENKTAIKKGIVYNKKTGAKITACLPMHTFGHPARIGEIADVCKEYNIPLVEDAAESLGSFVGDLHVGTTGILATLSFNGNKVITTGGGGMILTNDHDLAMRAKHLTTTAKVPHAYDFVHDDIGYNYRMPNLNASLGCAQMEQLELFVMKKRQIAELYADHFRDTSYYFFKARPGTNPNYWLNALILDSRKERDAFLEYTNSRGIMTRPIWTLMNRLKMFKNCENDSLENSLWVEDRLVNLPSSVP